MKHREITATANVPQGQFLQMLQKYRAFIGGYGSGKTWIGGEAQCLNFWKYSKINQGYFAPTYAIIRDIFYPTIEEVAATLGLSVEIKQGNHEVHFYSGRQYRGTTICRSLDHPETIVGFKIGHASIDEIDTMPINKAENAWRKIIARMRYNVAGLKNGIDIMSTPEGFKFCHKLFVQNVQEKQELKANYGIIQASTYDNESNLPDDYIPSLKEIYPAELIEAYINGQFVNLTSGTVYRNYDRDRCDSEETIRDNEPLFIGMDFNVQHMAASVAVQRSSGFHFVTEIKDIFDTPDMVKIIKERWKDKGHNIIVYPDATGKNRESVDASKSDIALLIQAGFAVRAKGTNPSVKDRIISANKAFETCKAKVNARLCPTIARCLEQQAYDDNGEPDKKSGFDHQNDATTYLIAYEFPVIRPIAKMSIVGV